MSAHTVEHLRRVNPTARGDQVLVKRGEDYFVVSSAWNETLVFPADAKGNVTDWAEVAGGIDVSREEAIRQLENDDFRA